MGRLDATITIEPQLRLCEVHFRYNVQQKEYLWLKDKDVIGYFHCWGRWENDQGYTAIFGIVELENGNVVTARPEQIHFIDEINMDLEHTAKTYREHFMKKGEER